MRALIYALGGGLGHLTRSLALARQLRKRVPTARISLLSNSALARRIIPEAPEPGLTVTFFDPGWDKGRIGEAIGAILRASWELFVVDSFPRGLGGELAPILDQVRAPKVLVHRVLPAAYVRRFELAAFVAERYDLVLIPGEDAPLASLGIARRTGPWLIRDADELRPRVGVRQDLRIPEVAKAVAVLGCGRLAEIEVLFEKARGFELDAEFRFFSPLDPLPRWPFFECILGFDAILGAGGYNSVAEARAAGRPLVALPQKRLYDDQFQRLCADERAGKEDTEDRLRQVLDGKAPCDVAFENGAAEAAALILQL